MQSFRLATGAAARSVSRRGYASASSGYASTNKNLRVTSETKLIYQGFTGRQGS